MDDTFEYVEAGGDVRLDYEKNYEAFLPYLSTMYNSTELAPLDFYVNFGLLQAYLNIDFLKVQFATEEEIARIQKLPYEESSSPIVNFSSADMATRAILVALELYKLQLASRDFPLDTLPTSTSNSPHRKLNFTYFSDETILLELEYAVPVVMAQFCEGWSVSNLSKFLDARAVLEGLVFTQLRCQLLRCIVANNPLKFFEVVDILFQLLKKLPLQYHLLISDMLYVLCELAPHHATRLRQTVVEMHLLSDLALKLTLDLCHDEVIFMNGIMRGNAAWLLNVGSMARVGELLLRIKDKLFSDVQAVFAQNKDSPDQLELSAILRVLNGIVGLYGVRFTDSELKLCLEVVKTARSERLVRLCLCFLLLCASQIIRLPQSVVNPILLQLLRSSHSEMPVLLAVYFHTNQINQVEEIVEKTLGMNVNVQKLGLYEMQKLFTQDLFSRDILAERALALKPSQFLPGPI